jgi:tetraacyldisaccharide 4'-kinase
VRRAPEFWRRSGVASSLLAPAAALYGAIAQRRLQRPALRAALPTIVVGGLTSGGDGKTPLAMALATRLLALGARPALLTRGYGRILHHAAPVLADPAHHDARHVGDEALLLARVAPTLVCADRRLSAQRATEIGVTVLVLDDGFHSRALAPDLTFLAIDADYGAGNGACLPAGPLRAPLQAQLAMADALAMIGDGAVGEICARNFDKKVLTARLVPDTTHAQKLAGARIVAFAGIARPEKFFRLLHDIGAQVVATRAFPDHHLFTPRDIAELRTLAQAHDAQLLTTEKDATRLDGIDSLPVSLQFDDIQTLDALLAEVLTTRVRQDG